MESGHIRRFTVDFRAPFEAAVMISVDAKRAKRIIASLKGLSSDVYEISGSYDIVAIIKAISIESLNKSMDRIRAIRWVALGRMYFLIQTSSRQVMFLMLPA